MTRPLLSAMLCAAACGSAKDPMPLLGDGFDCVAGVTVPFPSELAKKGQPYTVRVGVSSTCAGVTPTVQVVLSDPDGADVVKEVGPVQQDEGNGTFVDLSFTPKVAGTHRVLARFQPNLGLAQVDLNVAATRDTATQRVIGTELEGCAQIELFDSGRVACLWPVVQVFEVVGGRVGAAVAMPGAPVSMAFRAADTLWVLALDGTLSRWRDGASFSRDPDNTVNVGANGQVLATRDDAVVIQGHRATWVRPRPDGRLIAELQKGELETPNDELLYNWRSGEGYGAYSFRTACRATLGVDSVTCEPAPLFATERPFAMSNAGSWSTSLGPGGRLIGVRKRASIGTLVLSTNWQVSASSTVFGAEPVLDERITRGALYAVRLTERGLLIEGYEDGTKGPLVSVTHETAARYDVATHTLSLYRREE